MPSLPSLPGPFSDPRVITFFGLLATASVAGATLVLRARARRAQPAAPLDRVWHPQETVPLTPAEEDAFGEVVSRLSAGHPR
ncbi:hypothetical protein GPZ77_15070 [Streptomyces sp. QHH-9511]|uniref:hypothetical protein n=1 Tax=Streptomyces sp. QHH-9511 TaxID=2684468 RepID=UPI00131935E2|nr:hypothetical protein [Streptomyces sp. QHH-9511]QGZ49518.1 hypothetical protein GPZ77_15070 [Streptomyces sp. QHH-9511]